jgi:hypothetical protein
VCADHACDSPQPPPPGETWCLRRLDVELTRWLTGHPMRVGPVKVNGELLDYPSA